MAKIKLSAMIFRARSLWLFGPYLALIIWAAPDNFSVKEKVGFILYAGFLFWILSLLIQSKGAIETSTRPETDQSSKSFTALLLLSFAFLAATRLLPFIRFGEAPLGYDTGFYVWEFARSGFSMGTSRTFYLLLAPLYQLGMSPTEIIHFINILSQFLIAGSIYFLFRSTKIAARGQWAAVGVFLFAVSIIQFDAYWWMLPRQMLATGFLFMTLALISRYPFWAVLTACAGIFIHVLPFILFCAAWLIYMVGRAVLTYWREKKVDRKLLIYLLAGASIVIVILALRWGEMVSLLNYAMEHKGLATSFPFWVVAAAKGSFINISIFYFFNLIILPFTFFGLLHPALWGKETLKQRPMLISLLYIIFVGLFVLSLFPVLRQNRFIILSDLFFIVFAVPPLCLLISDFLRSRAGKVFLMLFLSVFVVRIGAVVLAQRPQLYQNELEEIRALATTAEPQAKIMTTSNVYTPWVKGYSERATFGPGLEQGLADWNYQTWINFWNGGSDDERWQLLNSIPGPLYIFIGQNEKRDMNYQQYIRNDTHFQPISAQVWKFIP